MKDVTADLVSTACPDCGDEICVSICASIVIDHAQLFCRAIQDLLLAYRINDPELGNLLETMLHGSKNWRDHLNSHVAFEWDKENDSVH